MAVPQILVDLDAQVTKTTGTMASASAALRGVAARIQAAVDKAIAGGATAADLAPVQAEVDALTAGEADLAAAIVENP